MTIPSKVHARFELALDVEHKAEQASNQVTRFQGSRRA